MRPGGQTSNADLQQKITDLRSKYDGLSSQQDELARAQEEQNAQYQDASSVVSEAKTAEGQALQENNYWENKARGLEQTAQQAGEQLDQFDLQTQNSQNQMGPVLQRVASAYDLANFYARRYLIDFYGVRDLGWLQKILENQNFGGAALVCFHAACMKMNAAALGIHTSVQVTLQLPQYFQVRDVQPNKAPDQFALANSENNNAAAQQAEINKRVATQRQHYVDQAAKRRNELAEAKARDQATAAELASARSSVSSSTDAMKDARTEVNEAADATRQKAGEVREVASEMQALGNSAKTQQTQPQQPAAGARQQPANRQPANQQPANQQPANAQPAGPLTPAPVGNPK